MRFGMFIHWGPVSLKEPNRLVARRWSSDRGIRQSLQAVDAPKFDADQWVKVAKDAGVKYIVLTTKHHDGFCLWDTKQTDHNIMKLAAEARRGPKSFRRRARSRESAFGTYYSTCDWHHPDFPLGSPGGQSKKPHPNLDRYEQYLRKQVEELIRNYGPLCTLWFDVPQEFSVERGQGVVRWFDRYSPTS